MVRCHPGRAAATWCAAATTTGGLVLLLRPELRSLGALLQGTAPPDLATVIVDVSAALLVLCAAWAWWALSIALATTMTGRATQWAGAPHWMRRLIVAGCGLSVIALPLAAQAEPTAGQPPGAVVAPSLEGLTMPALPATPRVRGTVTPRIEQVRAAVDRTVVVAPGDTLWSIARALLPAGANDREIELRWRALWRANRATIGADPNLIRPGLRLATGSGTDAETEVGRP